MTNIKDEGDKYADIQGDKTLKVFLNGAYNLGPIIEAREVTSAVCHPGMGVIHATGAAGEDDYTEHGNDSALSYAIVELDTNQIVDSQTVYAQYDNVPAIPYHMNPGAYVNNIECADQDAGDWEPDQPICAEATGVFGAAKEAGLVAGGATAESFAASASAGLNSATGATIHSRILLRNAYYTADPSAVTYRVCYIAKGE